MGREDSLCRGRLQFFDRLEQFLPLSGRRWRAIEGEWFDLRCFHAFGTESSLELFREADTQEVAGWYV